MFTTDTKKSISIAQAVENKIIGIPRLMTMPINIDLTDIKCNNVWMQEADEKGDFKKVEKFPMVNEWMTVYKELAYDGPVFLMSDPQGQIPNNDLVYTSNAGCVFKNMKTGTQQFVVSKFKSEVRVGEEQVIKDFVTPLFGIENVLTMPDTYNGKEVYWEGYASIKCIAVDAEQQRGTVYLMGDVRSSIGAKEWLEDTFDIQIIWIGDYMNEEELEYFYHLDVIAFPVNYDKYTDKVSVMLNTESFDDEIWAELEEICDVIPIEGDDYDTLYNGVTNNIKAKNRILTSTFLTMDDETAEIEEGKLEILQEIADERGYNLMAFPLDNISLSGGSMLSCLEMPLVDAWYVLTNGN